MKELMRKNSMFQNQNRSPDSIYNYRNQGLHRVSDEKTEVYLPETLEYKMLKSDSANLSRIGSQGSKNFNISQAKLGSSQSNASSNHQASAINILASPYMGSERSTLALNKSQSAKTILSLQEIVKSDPNLRSQIAAAAHAHNYDRHSSKFEFDDLNEQVVRLEDNHIRCQKTPPPLTSIDRRGGGCLNQIEQSFLSTPTDETLELTDGIQGLKHDIIEKRAQVFCEQLSPRSYETQSYAIPVTSSVLSNSKIDVPQSVKHLELSNRRKPELVKPQRQDSQNEKKQQVNNIYSFVSHDMKSVGAQNGSSSQNGFQKPEIMTGGPVGVSSNGISKQRFIKHSHQRSDVSSQTSQPGSALTIKQHPVGSLLDRPSHVKTKSQYKNELKVNQRQKQREVRFSKTYKMNGILTGLFQEQPKMEGDFDLFKTATLRRGVSHEQKEAIFNKTSKIQTRKNYKPSRGVVDLNAKTGIIKRNMIKNQQQKMRLHQNFRYADEYDENDDERVPERCARDLAHTTQTLKASSGTRLDHHSSRTALGSQSRIGGNHYPKLNINESRSRGQVYKDKNESATLDPSQRTSKDILSFQVEYKDFIDDCNISSNSNSIDESDYAISKNKQIPISISFKRGQSKFEDRLLTGHAPNQEKKQLHKTEPKGVIQSIKNKHIPKLAPLFLPFMDIFDMITLQRSCKILKQMEPHFSKQYKFLIMSGLSTAQRLHLWYHKASPTPLSSGSSANRARGIYKGLIEQNCPYESDIQKDIDRTFTDYHYFMKGNKGYKYLWNLLRAVTTRYKKLDGYIQGMNFLAAAILINLQNQEAAFWMMIQLLSKYKLDELFSSNFLRYRILCYQLDMFVKAYMPKLYEKFELFGLTSEYYASQWFITLFCYDMPIEVISNIIDLFLIENWKCFIRVALALLKSVEYELLTMQYDDLMIFLKTFTKSMEFDTQSFFSLALSFKVNQRLMNELEEHYHKGQSTNLSLKRHGRQMRWICLDSNPYESLESTSKNGIEYQRKTKTEVRPTRSGGIQNLGEDTYNPYMSPKHCQTSKKQKFTHSSDLSHHMAFPLDECNISSDSNSGYHNKQITNLEIKNSYKKDRDYYLSPLNNIRSKVKKFWNGIFFGEPQSHYKHQPGKGGSSYVLSQSQLGKGNRSFENDVLLGSHSSRAEGIINKERSKSIHHSQLQRVGVPDNKFNPAVPTIPGLNDTKQKIITPKKKKGSPKVHQINLVQSKEHKGPFTSGSNSNRDSIVQSFKDDLHNIPQHSKVGKKQKMDIIDNNIIQKRKQSGSQQQTQFSAKNYNSEAGVATLRDINISNPRQDIKIQDIFKGLNFGGIGNGAGQPKGTADSTVEAPSHSSHSGNSESGLKSLKLLGPQVAKKTQNCSSFADGFAYASNIKEVKKPSPTYVVLDMFNGVSSNDSSQPSYRKGSGEDCAAFQDEAFDKNLSYNHLSSSITKQKVVKITAPGSKNLVVNRKSLKSNPLIHLKGSEPLTPKNHPGYSRNKQNKIFLSSSSNNKYMLGCGRGSSKRFGEELATQTVGTSGTMGDEMVEAPGNEKKKRDYFNKI